jgi:uncharacterized OB-fold protein
MPRKLPQITVINAPFWQGGKDSALLIHFCRGCALFFHPPAPVCPRCLSFDVAPRPVSGRGRVITYTVNHQRWTPDLEVPFVIAIVELVEQSGLRFLTNIIDCQPAEVSIDMPVRVRFQQVEDVWLPQFERDL